jgi:hypothetical protein
MDTLSRTAFTRRSILRSARGAALTAAQSYRSHLSQALRRPRTTAALSAT